MPGLCKPILIETSTDLSYMPQGWILHLRSRFNEWGGQMWIEHQWTSKLQREHDSSLMKAFSKLPGATKQKLEKCNMCRLYSRVITVSDINDKRGTHIPWRKYQATGSQTQLCNYGQQCQNHQANIGQPTEASFEKHSASKKITTLRKCHSPLTSN